MSKMSQKECVFSAVQAFLQENGREIELDNGQAIQLTKTEKQTVVGMICGARDLMELSAEADTKFDTVQKFKTYVIGLTNNWLRKDIRLNGGSPYVTKNPGSRAGSGDEVLKNLKALATQVSDDDKAEVEKAIAERIEKIKSEKTPKVEINPDALPEHLRHLVKA